MASHKASDLFQQTVKNSWLIPKLTQFNSSRAQLVHIHFTWERGGEGERGFKVGLSGLTGRSRGSHGVSQRGVRLRPQSLKVSIVSISRLCDLNEIKCVSLHFRKRLFLSWSASII